MIIKIFLFLLPAGVANMAPVVFKRSKVFKYPVDLGKKFQGQPLFGSHKTYRGFFVGIMAAILTVWLLRFFYGYNPDVFLINYQEVSVLGFGFCLGFGALFADLVKSFFKRRKSLAPGKSWVPFDQLDWVVGALIFSSFYIRLSWQHIITAIVLFGALHPLINLLGYNLGIKKNKF